MALAQDLENFLLAHRQVNCRDFMLQQNQTARVVLLGETHVGLAAKARFLGDVIQGATNRTQPRFHASEHFLAEASHRVAIQNYVYATSQPSAARLPARLRPFVPLLEAARTFPSHGYAILAGGSSASSGRDLAIYQAFTGSIQRHNTLFSSQQITTSTKGSFLIGAAHGARRNASGSSTATTTQLLVQGGYTVSVIRLVVNVTGGASDTGVITGGENISVEPMTGGGGAIDLLPIVVRVAAGSMFYAVITGSASPFSGVKDEGGASIPFNDLYDAILYLPG